MPTQRSGQPLHERGEDGSVRPVHARSWVGTAQDSDFVPEHEELDVLIGERWGHQQDQSEHLPEDQIQQPQRHVGIMSHRRSPLVSDQVRLLAPHRVLDADIEACFDSIDHTALLDRVRRRVKDKRVLGLVKAFCKAGVLTETGQNQATLTGTPQGGILSPLLANIALTALDEQLMAPWKPGGTMSTRGRRAHRRRYGRPNWRIVRYADDFVVLVDSTGDTEGDVARLREEITDMLAPLGLRLSAAKTRIVHMSEGFDFLGFRIQWRRKRGSNRWYVYTFIADRPVRQLKDKIRALTNRTSQHNPRDVLIRINQILRGWVAYFRHAVCKTTLKTLDHFVWRRVSSWWMVLHRWTWTGLRRRFTDPHGRWRPLSADGIELFATVSVPVTRYRYRGNTIPRPWSLNHALMAETVESPVR